MKGLMIFLKIVLTILFIFTIIFWLMALASSHNVPAKTYVSLALTGLLLLVLLILIVYWDRKKIN